MEPGEFGRFTLLDHLGRGGMASVYRARNNEDGSIVAIKIFEPSEERSAELMRRLKEREVRMLLSIQHPNVVKFYETGQQDERYYYAMEFVGDSLLKRMRKRDEFTLLEKVRILRQTANALQAIHHQGIVHRDIKPGNILLDRDPNEAIHVKVTDLGIAKDVSEADIVRDTTSTRIPGTPKYLSPEQIGLELIDGRSDIFSLGVVAYELLAGTAPVKAQTTDEYLEANLQQEPEPVSQLNDEIPPFLDQLVAKMLAKDREQRYDSDTLARDLELLEQHLVSGAPLLELNNPDSIFYVPTEPQEEEVAVPEGRLPVLKVSWAAIAALALLAALSGYHLWPEAPALVGRENPPLEIKPSADELLRTAVDRAADGADWHALNLLSSIERESLDGPQRTTFEQLLATLRDRLAGPSHEAGARMLAEGRFKEAEVLLRRMEEFFPEAGPTVGFRDKIEDFRRAAALQKEWDEGLARARDLKEKSEFADALQTLDQLLERFAAEGPKRTVGRREVAAVLNAWGNALAQGAVTPAVVKDYLDAVGRYEDRGWPELVLRVRADELYLKLAGYYRERGDYEEATRYYELIIEGFQGPLAERAKEAREQIGKELLLKPITIGAFVREFERRGFSRTLWRAETGPKGEQRYQDGTVLLVQKAGEGPSTNLLETLRPLKNLGFRIGAEFKIEGLPSPPGRWEAGLEVEDKGDNAIMLRFDGNEYRMIRRQKAGEGVISGGTSLRKAFGDEGDAWHRMGLHYLFESGRIEVLLDGERAGQFPLDLGQFRFRILLWTDGAAECSIAFRGITCEP